VAATDYDEGLISQEDRLRHKLWRQTDPDKFSEDQVVQHIAARCTIFNFIPLWPRKRGQIKLSPIELDKAVTDGLDWAVDKG